MERSVGSGSRELGANHLAVRLVRRVFALLQQGVVALLQGRSKSKTRRMALVESLELGNRRQLLLVLCDDHHFLVGAGADRVGTVVAMPEAAGEDRSHQSRGQRPPATQRPSGSLRSACAGARLLDGTGSRGLQLVKRRAELSGSANRQPATETGNRPW